MGAYGAASEPAYRLQAHRGAYLSGLQACRAASQKVRKCMGKPIGVHTYQGCKPVGPQAKRSAAAGLQQGRSNRAAAAGPQQGCNRGVIGMQ